MAAKKVTKAETVTEEEEKKDEQTPENPVKTSSMNMPAPR